MRLVDFKIVSKITLKHQQHLCTSNTLSSRHFPKEQQEQNGLRSLFASGIFLTALAGDEFSLGLLLFLEVSI